MIFTLNSEIVIQTIKRAIINDSIFWKDHFLQRVRDRKIRFDDVFDVLADFEVIESYIDDKPFPSFLILGYVQSEAFHVVVSVNVEAIEIHMITIYRPDPDKWTDSYRRRT